MSEPTRYNIDIVEPHRSLQTCHVLQQAVDPGGAWVRYEDVAALTAQLAKTQRSNAFLKDQLEQLADFNPDWDRLQAANESLREHMATITALQAEATALREALAELKPRHSCPSCDLEDDERARIDGWNEAIAAVSALLGGQPPTGGQP